MSLGLLLALLPIAAAGPSAPLTLVMEHVLDGQPLQLDSIRYQNTANERFSITRLSYLLSDFALITDSGERHSLRDQVAWIDQGKRRTELTLPRVPLGNYQALCFQIGLEESINTRDPAQYPATHPLNANLNDLHWDWQSGYIFLALEGLYRSPNDPSIHGFSYHFARSPNRKQLELPTRIELTGPTTVVIKLELRHLLEGVTALSFRRDGQTTHSVPKDPIAAAIKENLSAFSVTSTHSLTPDLLAPSPLEPLFLPSSPRAYPFKTSRHFPLPNLPRDNPLLTARVALGKQLFQDVRLSADNSLACRDCHQEEAALSDPRRFSLGIEQREGTRQSMPLFNLAWKPSFFWDGRAQRLRDQVLMPIQDHLEMAASLDQVTTKLRADASMSKAFNAAFGSSEITSEKLALALENFLLTQTSYDSKFDRVRQGRAKFTLLEQRGFELFNTEYEPRSGRRGADCFHCHGGPLFTDHAFRNNGLDELADDLGRQNITGQPSDRGKFATPSLRNIALSAPYMHDGRFTSLGDVVTHYCSNVKRSATLDPNLAKHPNGGVPLSPPDQAALVAFLHTLTDPKFVHTAESIARIAIP